MYQNITHGKNCDSYIGIFKGIGYCLLFTLLGGAAISGMIISGKIQEMQIGYAAMIILILSAGAGSIITIRKKQNGRVVTLLGIAGGYFLSLALLNMLLFRGVYTGMGETFLIIFGSSFAGLFVTSRPKRKQSGHKKRRKHG